MNNCLRVFVVALVMLVGDARAQLARDVVDHAGARRQGPRYVPLRDAEEDADEGTIREMPSDERLNLEVEIVSRIARLSHEQTALLRERGQREIGPKGGVFHQAAAVNERRLRVWLNGQLHSTAAPLTESPTWALRRALVRHLNDISPAAGVKYKQERERLDVFRKRAAALAQVAVFDECLLLSGEQRSRLLDLLLLPTSDAWWRPAGVAPTLDTAFLRWLAALSGGELGTFFVPDVDLNGLLRGSQKAGFKQVREPLREELVLEQKLRGQQAGGMVANGVAQVDVIIVQQGPRADDQRQRLTFCLTQRIDEIDATCTLTAAQRDKLRLAGQLDIERVRPAELPAKDAGEGDAVRIVRVTVGAVPLPLSTFNDDASYFQKAVQGRLVDEQKQKLATAERQRRAFQRRALIAAVVLRLQRAAALTAEQCGKLTNLVAERLDQTDAPSSDWRRRCLSQIAGIPEETLRACCFDFQFAPLVREQSQLGELADRLETMTDNGRLEVIRDKQGRVMQINDIKDDPDL